VSIQALQSGTNLLGVFVIVSDEEKKSITLTPEGELGVGVGRGLLAPVPGKKGGFDGHEVLHQQVPLFELGQTEKIKDLVIVKHFPFHRCLRKIED
jgi:hypothetical protein